MKAILAGNHEQFIDWCHKNKIDPNSKDILEVKEPLDVISFMFTDYEIVGSFWSEGSRSLSRYMAVQSHMLRY